MAPSWLSEHRTAWPTGQMLPVEVPVHHMDDRWAAPKLGEASPAEEDNSATLLYSGKYPSLALSGKAFGARGALPVTRVVDNGLKRCGSAPCVTAEGLEGTRLRGGLGGQLSLAAPVLQAADRGSEVAHSSTTVQLENMRLREEIHAMCATIKQQSSQLSQLWAETSQLQARGANNSATPSRAPSSTGPAAGGSTGSSLVLGIAEMSRQRLEALGNGSRFGLERSQSSGALLEGRNSPGLPGPSLNSWLSGHGSAGPLGTAGHSGRTGTPGFSGRLPLFSPTVDFSMPQTKSYPSRMAPSVAVASPAADHPVLSMPTPAHGQAHAPPPAAAPQSRGGTPVVEAVPSLGSPRSDAPDREARSLSPGSVPKVRQWSGHPEHQVCACGNTFLADAPFCHKCGARRPSVAAGGSRDMLTSRTVDTVLTSRGLRLGTTSSEKPAALNTSSANVSSVTVSQRFPWGVNEGASAAASPERSGATSLGLGNGGRGSHGRSVPGATPMRSSPGMSPGTMRSPTLSAAIAVDDLMSSTVSVGSVAALDAGNADAFDGDTPISFPPTSTALQHRSASSSSGVRGRQDGPFGERHEGAQRELSQHTHRHQEVHRGLRMQTAHQQQHRAASSSTQPRHGHGEAREMLARQTFEARFEGTRLAPPEAQQPRARSAKPRAMMAVFRVIRSLEFEMVSQFGDRAYSQGEEFVFCLDDSLQEVQTKVRSLRLGEIVMITRQHDYVTSGGSKHAERIVTHMSSPSKEAGPSHHRATSSSPVDRVSPNKNMGGISKHVGGGNSSASNALPSSAGSDRKPRLRIKMESANGLRDADLIGKSDPYCICEIPGRSHTKHKTKVMNNCLNPIWDEEYEIAGYCEGDPLEFTIMDRDMWPKHDDFLGKATLRASQFYPDGWYGDLALQEAGPGVHATVKVKVEVLGLSPVEVLSPTRARSQSPLGRRAKVKVMLVGARGLRSNDWIGNANPFCICEIPGKPHTKFQTKHVKNNSNPEWNQEYSVSNYVNGDPLLFTVLDKERWPSTERLLGKALMRSTEFFPDGWFGALPLTDAGNGVKATLRVKIDVVGLEEENAGATQARLTQPGRDATRPTRSVRTHIVDHHDRHLVHHNGSDSPWKPGGIPLSDAESPDMFVLGPVSHSEGDKHAHEHWRGGVHGSYREEARKAARRSSGEPDTNDHAMVAASDDPAAVARRRNVVTQPEIRPVARGARSAGGSSSAGGNFTHGSRSHHKAAPSASLAASMAAASIGFPTRGSLSSAGMNSDDDLSFAGDTPRSGMSRSGRHSTGSIRRPSGAGSRGFPTTFEAPDGLTLTGQRDRAHDACVHDRFGQRDNHDRKSSSAGLQRANSDSSLPGAQRSDSRRPSAASSTAGSPALPKSSAAGRSGARKSSAAEEAKILPPQQAAAAEKSTARRKSSVDAAPVAKEVRRKSSVASEKEERKSITEQSPAPEPGRDEDGEKIQLKRQSRTSFDNASSPDRGPRPADDSSGPSTPATPSPEKAGISGATRAIEIPPKAKAAVPLESPTTKVEGLSDDDEADDEDGFEEGYDEYEGGEEEPPEGDEVVEPSSPEPEFAAKPLRERASTAPGAITSSTSAPKPSVTIRGPAKGAVTDSEDSTSESDTDRRPAAKATSVQKTPDGVTVKTLQIPEGQPSPGTDDEEEEEEYYEEGEEEEWEEGEEEEELEGDESDPGDSSSDEGGDSKVVQKVVKSEASTGNKA